MEIVIVVVLVCSLIYWYGRKSKHGKLDVPFAKQKKERHWLDDDLHTVKQTFFVALRAATTVADVDEAEAAMLASEALAERIEVTDKIREECVQVATRWRSILALRNRWVPERDLVVLGTVNGIEYVWKNDAITHGVAKPGRDGARGFADDWTESTLYVTRDSLIYDSPSQRREKKMRDIVDMSVTKASGSFSDLVLTLRNRVNKEHISFQAGIEAHLVVDIITHLQKVSVEPAKNTKSHKTTKTPEM